MMDRIDRRTLLALAGTAWLPAAAHAAEVKTLTLTLAPRDVVLRPGTPNIATWRFAEEAPRFAQGDGVEVTIANQLPVDVLIHWRGLDGAASLEPILARGPVAAGGSAVYRLNLAHAGTLICEARLGSDSASKPLPVLPLIVAERTPPDIDRDIVLLFEEWRLPLAESISKSTESVSTQPLWTVNGTTNLSIDASAGDRLRLRFINGTQRAVVAIQVADIDVRVVAIDGQPSEPFFARDRRVMMAPGTRVDSIVEVGEARQHSLTLNDGERSVSLGTINVVGPPKPTHQRSPLALSSNGLPDKLQLQQALRVDLAITPEAGWKSLAAMSTSAPPIFQVKRGRTVVLTLTNPSDSIMVVQLHGHHMRLLDRLDDGWKPFWLDTLAVASKQTVRVAFSATHAGAFLMEAISATATARRLLQSYRVET